MPRFLLAISCWLLLAGCALEYEVPAATAGPLDSAFRASAGLRTGRVKFKGPVTFQVVAGTNNTTTATTATKPSGPVATGASQAQDFTKAGQNGGANATAPGSSAGATTRTGVPTWQLVASGAFLLLLIMALVYLRVRTRATDLLKMPV